MQQQTKNWCFICEKEFVLKTNDLKQCPQCHQQAYQQITSSSHPEKFQAYSSSQRPSSSNSNSSQQQQQQQPNFQQGLLQPILGLINTFQNVAQTAIQNSNTQNRSNQNQNQSSNPNNNNNQSQLILDFLNQAIPSLSNSWPQIVSFTSQIANVFMQNLVNSGQSFRRATQAQINELQRINNPKDCAICQGGSHSSEGYRLKCHHEFHAECIRPWFERANTCPTCRDTL